MSYGLQVRDASNRLILDSTSIGGVFVEELIAPAGNSGSKSYPALVGRSVRIYNTGAGSHVFTLSGGGGTPVISWSTRAAWIHTQSVALVFAI